jgi:hypothetical protein
MEGVHAVIIVFQRSEAQKFIFSKHTSSGPNLLFICQSFISYPKASTMSQVLTWGSISNSAFDWTLNKEI